MARPRREEQIQNDNLTCDVSGVVDIGRVREARAALPDSSSLHALTSLFGALADPTRLRIAASLERGELCVCDIAAAIGLSESATSHQLRVLRDLGLVRPRRAGRMVFYSLDDAHVRIMYRQALDHVAHGRDEGTR
jgi:DNA-binding transcriptional ArsR family regulator